MKFWQSLSFWWFFSLCGRRGCLACIIYLILLCYFLKKRAYCFAPVSRSVCIPFDIHSISFDHFVCCRGREKNVWLVFSFNSRIFIIEPSIIFNRFIDMVRVQNKFSENGSSALATDRSSGSKKLLLSLKTDYNCFALFIVIYYMV